MDTAAVDHFDTGRFEASRNRLASLAYRMLGSAVDAEDTVQDAFLHWQAADRERIRVPEAWLTKVVTNLCLDRLRSARARRERSVGAWLPEPLLDGDPMLGPADTFEQRESVSLAVLTLMERLSPWSGPSTSCARRSPTATPRSPGSSTSPSPRASSTCTGRGAASPPRVAARPSPTRPPPAGSSRSSSPPPPRAARTGWCRCSRTTRRRSPTVPA